jgi:hypothetical protein
MTNFDVLGRSPAQADKDAETAKHLCNTIFRNLDGESAGIVFNLAGLLAVVAFREIYGEDPDAALQQFERWVDYTRSALEGDLGKTVQ